MYLYQTNNWDTSTHFKPGYTEWQQFSVNVFKSRQGLRCLWSANESWAMTEPSQNDQLQSIMESFFLLLHLLTLHTYYFLLFWFFFFHVASLLNSRCWKRRDIKYPKAQLLQSSSSQIKSGSKSLYVKMSTTVDLLENWILSVVKERFPNYWIFWTGLFIYCCHFKGLKAALWIFILAFSSYSGNTYLLNTTADFLC